MCLETLHSKILEKLDLTSTLVFWLRCPNCIYHRLSDFILPDCHFKGVERWTEISFIRLMQYCNHCMIQAFPCSSVLSRCKKLGQARLAALWELPRVLSPHCLDPKAWSARLSSNSADVSCVVLLTRARSGRCGPEKRAAQFSPHRKPAFLHMNLVHFESWPEDPLTEEDLLEGLSMSHMALTSEHTPPPTPPINILMTHPCLSATTVVA